jgi:hypothetical protein
MAEPKDGDFAAYLDQQQKNGQPVSAEPQPSAKLATGEGADQTEGVLNISAETLMDEEAVDRLAAQMREQAEALADLPPMTDEELEQQALEAGGADNDASTPE